MQQCHFMRRAEMLVGIVKGPGWCGIETLDHLTVLQIAQRQWKAGGSLQKNVQKVRLAAAGRPMNNKDRRRPVGPALKPSAGFTIVVGDEKILVAQRGRMVEIEQKLFASGHGCLISVSSLSRRHQS
jgi:hypothetical protein